MSKYLLAYKFASIITGCALSGFLALGPVYAAPAPAPAPHRVPSIHRVHRAPSIHDVHHGAIHGSAAGTTAPHGVGAHVHHGTAHH
ncbi:hypothetical protein ccbrp13_16380 [Ktedonobacteria bacterium brp13]|nr:hypothetical protein ccbrp13_16380 [Ktedonobacteria bacterium brp13]